MIFTQASSLLVAVILLIATSLSFPSKLNFPEPDIARFTGYPTWHSDIKGLDPESFDAILFFSNLVGLVIVIMTTYWILFHRAPKNSITYLRQGNISTPSTLFIASIVMYLATTTVAGISFQLFDLGKLWSGPGLLHNMFELVLIYVLWNGGKIDPCVLFWILTIYSTTVIAATSNLKYPYDVAFFKIQGLSFDFALPIMIARILYNTMEAYRYDSHRPINQPVDEQQAGDVESAIALPTTIDHPKQLWYLFIPFALHLLGNIAITCSPADRTMFVVFLMSYINLFQFLGYYVYIETHDHAVNAQKRYYLPEINILTVVNISVWSFALSLLSNRIGLDHLNK